MTTCNGARFITSQLESLALQTLLPVELIVNDDCSDDQTLAIIQGFARTAPFPVRVQRNEKRLGYRANFMRAASRCRGSLVALCDQDDVWHPDKLAICAAAFDVEGVLLVYHDADLIDHSGRRTRTLCQRLPGMSGHEPGSCPPLSFVMGFSQVFDRSLLRFSDLWSLCVDPNFVGEPIAHDVWFFFLASVQRGILYVNKRLAGYRQHEGNATAYHPVTCIPPWIRGLRGRGGRFALHAVAANCCADALEGLAARLEYPMAAQVTTMLSTYRDFARICEVRSGLYTSSNAVDRLSAWRQLYSSGSHRRTDWTAAPRRTLLEDLVVGVPLGPALTRFGDWVRLALKWKRFSKVKLV